MKTRLPSLILLTALIFNQYLFAQKVGIGSTQFTPSSTLDVKGNSTIGSGYAGSNAAPTNGVIIEGNVGVGTHTPAEKLDVSGKTKTSTIQITGGSPANGKVLTASDGNGNAGWETAASGGCNCHQWTLVAVANSTYAATGVVSTGYTVQYGKEYLLVPFQRTIGDPSTEVTVSTGDACSIIQYSTSSNGGTIYNIFSAVTGAINTTGLTYYCPGLLSTSTSYATYNSLSNMIPRMRFDGLIELEDISPSNDGGLYLFER